MDGESDQPFLILVKCIYTVTENSLINTNLRVSIDGDVKVLHDNEQAPPDSDDKALQANQSQKQAGQNQTPEQPNTDGTRPQPEKRDETHNQSLNDKVVLESTDHGIKSLEESMIERLGFLPGEDDELEQTADGKTLYIVFSTDCGSFQHWQSYLLFFSAIRIRQPGFITRIASGCTEEEKHEAKDWFQEHIAVMSTRFRIMFTPKFAEVKDDVRTVSVFGVAISGPCDGTNELLIYFNHVRQSTSTSRWAPSIIWNTAVVSVD